MGKKYKKPPIVEALCEFRFVPSLAMDITIFGLFYGTIRDEFPTKQMELSAGVAAAQPKVVVPEYKIEPRTRFCNKDNTSIVQLGADWLTVNQLRPYPGWKEFKALILKVLERYIAVASPKGFRQIVLRYLNTFDLPDTDTALAEHFTYYPLAPATLLHTNTRFQLSIEVPYESERDLLRLSLATIIAEKPGLVSYLLDIGYLMVVPEHIGLSDVSGWLEGAHATVEKTFEASITDRCRSHFEEVK